MADVRKTPCPQCPYRKDSPSGVWATEEYEKLRAYDAPTGEQPFQAFGCHATPDKLCHGWACVGTSRGHEFDLLALRIAHVESVPDPAVPLWSSGNEAADHGQRDIDTPTHEAHRAIEILRRYPRLRYDEEGPMADDKSITETEVRDLVESLTEAVMEEVPTGDDGVAEKVAKKVSDRIDDVVRIQLKDLGVLA